MRLHILVEGPSEESFLNAWLPRFLPHQHSFQIITHQGKGRLSGKLDAPPVLNHRGLLDQLPAKLRAYERELNPDTDRVLVLVDADDDSCLELKNRLVKALKHCAPNQVGLVRIAVEETEAFYLGDRTALKRAYPQAKLAKLDGYRQDSICGTWEFFRDVIGADCVDKPSWGEKIGTILGTEWTGTKANASISFRHFCAGILWLAGEVQSRTLSSRRGQSRALKSTRPTPRK